MGGMTIRPAGDGRHPLLQRGELLPTGLVWVDYAVVDGKPMTGTITQEQARRSGIEFAEKDLNGPTD